MNNNRREVTPDALQEIIRQTYESTTQTPDETRIRLIRHRLMADQPSKQCAQPKRSGRFSIWVFGFAFVAFGAAASWWFSDILWPAQPVAVSDRMPTEVEKDRHPGAEAKQPTHKKENTTKKDNNISGNNRASDESVIYRHEPL